MSDNEEDLSDDGQEEEEDEEEEEENEEEEEEEENEEEEIDEEEKKRKTEEDIQLLHDIFNWIDVTTQRITDRLELKSTEEKRPQNKNSWDKQSSAKKRNSQEGVSFSQYESLSEAERADLLERALMSLAADNN